MSVDMLATRAVGCLAGAAVGDALGGATEGWESREIHDHYGGWVEGIVQSMRHRLGLVKPFSPVLEGRRARHRRHLDDPRPRAGLRAKRDHLDAYDLEELVVPLIVDEPTLDPRARPRGPAATPALPRGEVARAQAPLRPRDPRDAGVGNIVNCGAAMYIAPVGIANAGDPGRRLPRGARPYAGPPVELRPRGGGRLAAAVAEAMRPGATPDSVVAAAMPARQGRRRGRRSRRSPRPPPASTAGATGALATCGPPSRRSTRSETHYATTGSGRPHARAGSTRSRRCRSRSGCCSRRTATTSRRCSAASTTAATPTRSPRWAARSPGRSARRVPRRAGRRGRRPRAGSTSRSPGASWPTWPARSWHETGSASKPAPAALAELAEVAV